MSFNISSIQLYTHQQAGLWEFVQSIFDVEAEFLEDETLSFNLGPIKFIIIERAKEKLANKMKLTALNLTTISLDVGQRDKLDEFESKYRFFNYRKDQTPKTLEIVQKYYGDYLLLIDPDGREWELWSYREHATFRPLQVTDGNTVDSKNCFYQNN